MRSNRFAEVTSGTHNDLMELNNRAGSIVRFLWTIYAMASSFPVLALILGDAAWNGINFALSLYLTLAIGGFVGLLAGFYSAFSRKRFFAWITCVSAIAIALLSMILAAGFVLGRTSGESLDSRIAFGRFSAPIFLFYVLAFLSCSGEAMLFFPKILKTKPIEP